MIVPKPSARYVAALALAGVADAFPDLDPTPFDTAGLDPRDTGLALAIHRTALQRWLTIAYLLDLHLRKPMASLEPALQGVLMAAGAQLIFMDRLPAHAVVDESVELAKKLVRPGAAGLVNAVLRKLAALPQEHVHGQAWSPARDRLPLDDGYIPLSEPCLPAPANLEEHLAIAASCPAGLLRTWAARWGWQSATRLALQGVVTPPIIVAVEQGFIPVAATRYAPHAMPGFLVWRGSHAELLAFLAQHPARRVQDPAAALAVGATADSAPRGVSPPLILDFCAGRGTKSIQLAVTHPGVSLIATDIDPHKLAALRPVLARFPGGTAVEARGLEKHLAGRRADLILLDVPCSNTGVLARRPEARYRFSPRSLSSLCKLQKAIVDKALSLAAPRATVIYSTCSLEERENRTQAHRIPGRVLREETTLPSGRSTTYHDGGYFAVVQL